MTIKVLQQSDEEDCVVNFGVETTIQEHSKEIKYETIKIRDPTRRVLSPSIL